MSLKLYKTKITPDRNARVESIATYLARLSPTYSYLDFQYIKPDLDVNIKIDVSDSNNYDIDSIGNYAVITQNQGQDGEDRVYYYFILKSK